MSNAVSELFSNELIRKVLVRSRYILVPLLLIPVARYMRPELFWIGFAVSMFGQLIQTCCFGWTQVDQSWAYRFCSRKATSMRCETER